MEVVGAQVGRKRKLTALNVASPSLVFVLSLSGPVGLYRSLFLIHRAKEQHFFSQAAFKDIPEV